MSGQKVSFCSNIPPFTLYDHYQFWNKNTRRLKVEKKIMSEQKQKHLMQENVVLL
jgi:hypothetical protein